MSTFTTNKNIEQPAHNAFVDTWDTPVNANWSLIDIAFGSSVSINTAGLSGNQTLSLAQYQPLTINLTGAPAGAITYVVPTGVGGIWIVINNTTGGQTVGFKSNAGGATITIGAGLNSLLSCDGSVSGMRLANNVPTGTSAGGSNTQVQYNALGLFAGSANMTFNGTTLSVTGLAVAGNTILGLNSGNNIIINGALIGLGTDVTIGGSNLLFLKNSTAQIGIGTTALAMGNLLTVAGNIKLTTGGLVFSDGTQILTASTLGIPGGATGNVQFNNAGVFAGSNNLNWNAGTNTLTALNLTVTTTLTLSAPLPVASGGTGQTTATGSGPVVLQTTPTIGSPALSGTPTATTAAANDNSTRIATTAWGVAFNATVVGTFYGKCFVNNPGGGPTVVTPIGNVTFTPVRTGVGLYTIVMSPALPDNGFIMMLTGQMPVNSFCGEQNVARSTTQFSIFFSQDNAGVITGIDPAGWSMEVFH